MSKSMKYSVEEARRIILEMPNRSDSNDPQFSDGDEDIEDESVRNRPFQILYFFSGCK